MESQTLKKPANLLHIFLSEKHDYQECSSSL